MMQLWHKLSKCRCLRGLLQSVANRNCTWTGRSCSDQIHRMQGSSCAGARRSCLRWRSWPCGQQDSTLWSKWHARAIPCKARSIASSVSKRWSTSGGGGIVLCSFLMLTCPFTTTVRLQCISPVLWSQVQDRTMGVF